MGLYRWSAVAITFAAAALAMLLFVGWPWAWPFIITSWACSYMQARGPLANRKRMKLAAKETAAELEWLPSHRDDHRRPFEPFCECPKCRLATYHVFGPPREHVDSDTAWKMGPGHVWVESEEVAIWNRPGTYRVRHETGELVTKKRVTLVVDRECLSCEHTWTEKAA